MKREPRLAAAVLISGASLVLAQAVGGCELLVDASKLTEQSDATSEDGSGSGSSSGGADGPFEDAADATTDGTGSGSGGDASDSGDAMMATEVGPTDAPPCTGPLYYVSAASGNDANPGCSPAGPKKTIAAGIAAAKAYTASPPTIEVCAGTYAESNLKLDFAASLLGGFDCSTWAADGGAAAGASTITNASPTTQSATLVMFGSAVKLDGLTIQGAAAPATADGGPSNYTYSALEITGPGTPTISNNVLTGGSGLGGAPASAGIFVNGTSPLIVGNVVSGGAGSGGASGLPTSVGVFATNGGTLTLRGNTIDGGSGTGTGPGNVNGSAGVMTTTSVGNVTVVGNTINGGSGVVSTASSTGAGSFALWISGSPNPVPAITVTGNVLLGGTGSVVVNNTATSYAIRAVYLGYSSNLLFSGNTVDGGVVSSGGECPQAIDIAGTSAVVNGVVTVTGNRIHAGHCTAFATSLSSGAQQAGLRISGPVATVIVENNMIDGGQVDVRRYGEALDLDGIVGAQVRHNTLVAGGSAQYAASIWLQNGATTTATTIENNILAAIGPNAVAIQSDNAGMCLPDGGTPGVASFRNNLVFGSLAGFLRFNCSGGSLATSLDAMNTVFAAQGATVGGNVTIASSCAATDGGSLAGCITMPCATDGGTCLDTMFAGWDDPGAGYGNLFSDAGFEGGCPAVAPPVIGGIGDGWALATGGDAGTPPCVVARSSLSDVGDGGVAVDLYGNCRGTHPTMGAAEVPPGATCF